MYDYITYIIQLDLNIILKSSLIIYCWLIVFCRNTNIKCIFTEIISLTPKKMEKYNKFDNQLIMIIISYKHFNNRQ